LASSGAGWSAPVGIAGGLGLDALLGDPRRGHPVAAFGSVAARTERVVHRDSRAVGTAYALLLSGGVTVASGLVARRVRNPLVRTALTALATWSAVGGTTLRREALTMHALLDAGDVEGARERLPHLCGRDPAGLQVRDLVRATVESVAENTSDAVVAPLLWGALAGVPGLVGYRAVNTLDAMVGHRSPRYERFGWASARLDDVVNLAPARLTARLAIVLAPLADGRAAEARRVRVRDGHKHPSPNAGPVEAAFAGALGRTLGGRVVYSGRVEDRPLLGNGPAPTVGDIPRAVRLSTAVGLTAGVLAVGARGLVVRGFRR
jgi:adenosylcobinamide-phosphate synthase